jgi:two-component system LytT family response regulator
MNQISTTPIVFLNKKTPVNVNEILLLEGNINYTIIHFEEKSPMIIATTLKKIEAILKDYGFVRIHKSFLLNMNYADSSLLINNQVKNIVIKVSRRKRNELKERLLAA